MRILHTMLRVGNLERSIGFYTGVLGMHVLRTTDRPEQKYTLAFVGYGNESEGASSNDDAMFCRIRENARNVFEGRPRQCR